MKQIKLQYISLFLFFLGLLSSCKTPQMTSKENREHFADQLFMNGQKEKLLNNPSKAISIFEAYISAYPKDGAAYYELARLKLNASKFNRAKDLMKKAVSLEPNNKYYRLFYAKLLSTTGDYKKAEKEYDEYLQRFNAPMIVYKQYVNLLIRSNKIQKGIDILDQLEKKTGISEEISMQKRDLYLMQGKMSKGISEINKLSNAFPTKTKFLFILAELYNTNNQSDKAFQTYKKILKLDPDSPYIHISLSDYYRKKEMLDSSYYHLQKGFENKNLGVDDKVQILILLLTEKRDYKKQLNLAKIITKTHPKEAKGFTILGDIEYQENNLFNAERAYREAVTLDPNRYPIWEQLLIIDTELQKNYSTIEDAKKTIELFPEQALPYLILGGAYYLQKDYKNAVKVLEEGKSWTLNRVDLTIQLNAYLGDAYNELKEYKKSSDAYETVLLLDPDNIYVLNNYAYYLSLRKENLQRAKEMGKHAIELKPSTSTYLDTYAWILYQLMEYDEAEKFMHKALLNGGNSSAVIVEHYGDILWKLGKKEQAIEEWNKADAIGQGSPFLKQKISLNKMVE